MAEDIELTVPKDRTYGIDDFRFSGSYISRYKNCHGSAVLEETFPGFTAKSEAKTETTPKGAIKVNVIGTQVHKILEEILELEDILAAALVLDAVADLRGNKRTEVLVDEKAYITWWFLTLKNMEMPPLPFETLKKLRVTTKAQKIWNDEIEAYEILKPATENITPKQIRFMAEAIRYIYELIDGREGGRVYLEDKRTAEWTATKPKTTADIVITDGKTLDIVDIKIGTIKVSAVENEQLMYYAETYRTDETEFNLHILQPDNINDWELPADTLEAWVEEALVAEQAILDGSRQTQPGEHCGFCPANPYAKGERGTPVCPAQVEVLFGPSELTEILEDDD